MRVIDPDFDRRVDLPGVGPCPRPVEIDQTITGFSQIVSLRIYSFAEGMVIDGEAEEDEVFIVLMKGRVEIEVIHDTKRAFSLQTEVGARAIYLPPHHNYRLRATADSDVAYARARPISARAPKDFFPSDGLLSITGYAENMEITLTTIKQSDKLPPQCSIPAERLIHMRSEGGVLITAANKSLGNWQTASLSPKEVALFAGGGGNAEILIVNSSSLREL